MDGGTRGELLDQLAGAIEAASAPHPLRIAVDGPPAAGKSLLADELAAVVRARGREVIRATVDSFMLARAERYRHGEDSPHACYRRSFDYATLCRVLLDPLGRMATAGTATRSMTGTPTALYPGRRSWRRWTRCCWSAGYSLQRPELIDRWDLRIRWRSGRSGL
ncbi:MAG: hypothetical protein ABI140_12475 [Jatrophihabitantaceae bacterium]